MEKKRKKTGVVDSSSVKKGKLSSEVTFDAFFNKCVREGKLKFWQRKEILAFFRDLKLREKEDSEVYEANLSKY